jgi:hypothetical protein
VSDIIPERMAFSFTPITRKFVQDAMDRKEFPSVANLINHCITFYFENRNKQPPLAEFMEWVKSSDGEFYFKEIFQKMKEEDLL